MEGEGPDQAVEDLEGQGGQVDQEGGVGEPASQLNKQTKSKKSETCERIQQLLKYNYFLLQRETMSWAKKKNTINTQVIH